MSAILLKLDSLLRGHAVASRIAAALVVALCASFATPVRAQCVDRAERAPPAAVSAFIADPTVILRSSKNDRDKLTGRLTGVLVTDIAALDSVRAMLREASQADRIAIGAGLHRAEDRCVSTKPDVARRISEFVAKLHDGAVLKGYFGDQDAAAAPAPGSPAPPAVPASSSSSAGLMSGEWKTELADPFKPVPLPE
ncbi:hypothetical protein N2603_34750 [Bradyrhizobium huanghuaihaiense]|uniref:Uncharacterized protein n=1 Tax=Bradyrhizobium huanghuaihaiense TaxID=990078 RepID=A0A562QVW3_9BRAD|nr:MULTISPECIES: hypothetical protein [Bradyrhizobium]TWI60380.1 hypothetical protein IQ16_07637 [Bradyrhizobium huanghuaihaiense]UWU75167.1 hypothetical protein N2603_34750 [Bradyrhizobium sp. CB3035]